MKAVLPTDIISDDPTVVYSLTYPIRSKIFNFNKFVFNVDFKVFLQDNIILLCKCAGSCFIDKGHGYIVTGTKDRWK